MKTSICKRTEGEHCEVDEFIEKPMWTVIREQLSGWPEVTSGVPKVSVLMSIMFL